MRSPLSLENEEMKETGCAEGQDGMNDPKEYENGGVSVSM